MKNYTILERNVLASLATEEAQAAFLKACDKDRSRFKYGAEAYAREVDALSDFLDPLITSSGKMHGASPKAMNDLKGYIRERHWNMRHSR